MKVFLHGETLKGYAWSEVADVSRSCMAMAEGLSTEFFRLGRETFGDQSRETFGDQSRETFGDQCLDVGRSRLKASGSWSRSAFPVRGEALNSREVFGKYQVRPRRSESAPDTA